MFETIVQLELERRGLLLFPEFITRMANAVKEANDNFDFTKEIGDTVMVFDDEYERYLILRVIFQRFHDVPLLKILRIAEINLDEFLETISALKDNRPFSELPDTVQIKIYQ